MTTKIILFLSDLRKDAKEESYLCSDHYTVIGAQSNEAPVQYLLHKYPEVSEVLCIVTPKARETAWEHFTDFIHESAPDVILRDIPFAEGEDFTAGPLSTIMSCLHPKDSILLETTGGLRDAIMLLLLLSRILSYSDIHTVCAVYSNYQKHEIEDVSHLIHLFDLVGGMQELTSFGSARTLRTYYGEQPADERIGLLLTAVEQLSESITLCRTHQIDERMCAFDEALRDAENCKDPLLRELLPAFRAKFGKKLTTPGLIKWCEESDMLQQALTVYTERIPAFILNRGDLLTVTADAWCPKAKEYQDRETTLFLDGFLRLSQRCTDATIIPPVQALRNYVCGHKGAVVYLAQNKPTKIPPSIATGIKNLALICHLAYPGQGVPFQRDWTKRLSESKGFLRELEQDIARVNATNVYAMLYSVPNFSDHSLSVLLEQEDPEPQQLNWYLLTLEHLKEITEGSGYEIRCSIQQMTNIVRDYLYIKALRNMTNHANDESTESQAELLEYLEQFGYLPLEQVTAQELHHILKRALQNLRPVPKKER